MSRWISTRFLDQFRPMAIHRPDQGWRCFKTDARTLALQSCLTVQAACLFARQAARQIPHHHIAPPCTTTHPNFGGMQRYCLGLTVFHSHKAADWRPVAQAGAVLKRRSDARGATLDCCGGMRSSKGGK